MRPLRLFRHLQKMLISWPMPSLWHWSEMEGNTSQWCLRLPGFPLSIISQMHTLWFVWFMQGMHILKQLQNVRLFSRVLTETRKWYLRLSKFFQSNWSQVHSMCCGRLPFLWIDQHLQIVFWNWRVRVESEWVRKMPEEKWLNIHHHRLLRRRSNFNCRWNRSAL